MALAEHTRPVGNGMLEDAVFGGPKAEEAKAFCAGKKHVSVDYYAGRPIKTVISDRPLPDFWRYARDAGRGKAINVLRAAGLVED